MNKKGEFSSFSRRSAMVAIDGCLSLIALFLIIQMWILTATLESYLSGHTDTALPAAIISGILFCGSASLYWFSSSTEKANKQPERYPNVSESSSNEKSD
ncbi:MAG: hypothetical protein K2X77_26735 [Candidatus Obscuribacterales bacterium]|jgi:hypothetical protein|nr:hypothetical protein [Candidatus Obscuribacterales bacterium]